MMGQLVDTGYGVRQSRTLGFTPVIAAAAAASGPAAPLVLAASALVSLAPLLIKMFKKYDPDKLNDTGITEAFRIGANGLWNELTGDNLPVNCDPGQCGKQHVAIFTASRWPDVPYPAGRPGANIDQYIAAVANTIADARSRLIRPQSAAGFQENADYFMTLLHQVKERQAQEAPLATAFAAPGGLMSLLPWLIGGYAVYEFVL